MSLTTMLKGDGNDQEGQSMTFRKVAELCLKGEDTDKMDPDVMAEKLLHLKIARLDWNGFTNIGEIDALMSIEDLYLQHNLIAKIENLDFHMKLKFLILANNQIENVENLSHLRSLTLLDLSHNKIANFSVSELPKALRNVDFSGNPCCNKSDYRAKLIKGLPSLKVLDDEHLCTSPRDDDDDKRLHETSTPRVIKSARTTSVASRPSEALMQDALGKIDEFFASAKDGGKSLADEQRKLMIERSKQRMSESKELFEQRESKTMARPS